MNKLLEMKERYQTIIAQYEQAIENIDQMMEARIHAYQQKRKVMQEAAYNATG